MCRSRPRRVLYRLVIFRVESISERPTTYLNQPVMPGFRGYPHEFLLDGLVLSTHGFYEEKNDGALHACKDCYFQATSFKFLNRGEAEIDRSIRHICTQHKAMRLTKLRVRAADNTVGACPGNASLTLRHS